MTPQCSGSFPVDAAATRSDVRGLARLLAHLTVLACTGAGVLRWWSTFWMMPVLVLHGFAHRWDSAPR